MSSVASALPPDPADPDADPESPVGCADPIGAARAIALRLLERQPRTRVELERAMSRRGVSADVAAAVLDRFTEVGLIDDEAFATAWVESRHRGRGLARRALAAELRRRGVDEAVVKDAVAEVSAEDEQAAARALVARRLPAMTGLSADVRTRRLVGMLGRKGFSSGLAVKVVREMSGSDYGTIEE